MFGLASLVMVRLLGAPGSDCRSDCETIAAETDRQTCLLQCGQNDGPRDSSGKTSWRREERLGGSPPGGAHEGESGTTTTTETTNADGTTTTETTTTSKRGTTVKRTTSGPPTAAQPTTGTTPRVAEVRPVNAQAAGPWIVLASCQTRCDPDRENKRRAGCKLRCLEASPGLVRRQRGRP